MPSVLTHYGFSRSLFNDKLEFLRDNQDIYLLGSQGPDPFFFYGILPFLKADNKKEIRAYGTKLHKKDPVDSFEFFFEFANNSKEKDVLYSYILGAGQHFILDRKIHPYVFYKTGFSDDDKLKRKYFCDHTLFETNLDVLLLDDFYKDYKTTALNSILCDEDKVEEVSEMYYEFAKKNNEEVIEDDSFEDSYEHMCSIEKVLYSKRGIKKWFVNLLFKKTAFNTMMHPLKVKDRDKVDYLNTQKTLWKDPATETEHYESLYELIDQCAVEAKEWEQIVLKFYNGETVDLKSFTKKYIYDGYVEGNKMKVFENVYEKEARNK